MRGRQTALLIRSVMLLTVDHNERSMGSPVVQPGRVGTSQIDASVAHRAPEVVVPVGAMDGVAPVEVHCVGDTGQIVARS
jgi:hypothetical protein